MSDTTNQTATSNTAIELGSADLPAVCPNQKMQVWSSHPKVYLDMAHTGHAKCPYCGTEYRLKPGVVMGHSH